MPTYRSKVDWWMALLLAAVPAISLVVAVALQVSDDSGAAIIGWLTLAGVVVLYVALVWPIEYTLEPDNLVIRFGLVRSRLPYRSIRAVEPSRNPLAAQALSMDRLAIRTEKGLPTLISPMDRDRFLGDLVSRTPQLVRDGDRLRPR